MEKTRTAFGQRLWEARKAAKLSQNLVCQKIGISQGTLSELENSANSSGHIAALAALYNADPVYLATGKKTNKTSREIEIEGNTEIVTVRRVEFKLSAGISGYSIEYLNGERAPIIFRKDWLQRRGYFVENLLAVEVCGSSMEQTLYDGDLVVINTADTKPSDGEVFAANYEGELVIKRMIRDLGAWWLSSDNPDKRRYPNKKCDENCFILGKIVHRQSERI